MNNKLSANAQLLLELLESDVGTFVKLTSKEVRKFIGLRGHETRTAVNELRTNGYFVCSDKYGYWITDKIEDIQKTLRHLRSRRDKIDFAIHCLDTALRYGRDYLE